MRTPGRYMPVALAQKFTHKGGYVGIPRYCRDSFNFAPLRVSSLALKSRHPTLNAPRGGRCGEMLTCLTFSLLDSACGYRSQSSTQVLHSAINRTNERRLAPLKFAHGQDRAWFGCEISSLFPYFLPGLCHNGIRLFCDSTPSSHVSCLFHDILILVSNGAKTASIALFKMFYTLLQQCFVLDFGVIKVSEISW